MKEAIKKIFHKDENNKSNRMLQYIVVLFMLGVVLMIVSNFFRDEPKQQMLSAATEIAADTETEEVFGHKEQQEPLTIAEYEKRYAEQLKETLEAIVGVNNVSVMINVDTTAVKVYEKNISAKNQVTNETDSEGGKRTVEDLSKDEQIVIVRSGDAETPVLVNMKKPAIRGALIVAEGAENIHVKKMIVDAATKVLDVPVHKVAVLPKKLEEES